MSTSAASKSTTDSWVLRMRSDPSTQPLSLALISCYCSYMHAVVN